MTDINNEIIQFPYCKAPITVDKLGKYVNANPEIKKLAIEVELELWGDVYDRNYLIKNVVFCPNCARIGHLGDWLALSITAYSQAMMIYLCVCYS
jgi:hypothetical protein